MILEAAELLGCAGSLEGWQSFDCSYLTSLLHLTLIILDSGGSNQVAAAEATLVMTLKGRVALKVQVLWVRTAQISLPLADR